MTKYRVIVNEGTEGYDFYHCFPVYTIVERVSNDVWPDDRYGDLGEYRNVNDVVDIHGDEYPAGRQTQWLPDSFIVEVE